MTALEIKSCRFSPDEIHVWCFNTEESLFSEPKIADCLAPEELSRISRLHTSDARRRLTNSTIACRVILSGYLRVEPGRIKLFRTKPGKPVAENNKGFFFSLSHSQELSVLGVACFPGIGLDIEKILPIGNSAGLAEACLSDEEILHLHSYPSDNQDSVFYDYWTRKESVVKADGRGMSVDLRRFSVSLGDSWSNVNFIDQQAWQVTALNMPQHWAGAVAAERKCRIRMMTYDTRLTFRLRE